MAEQLKDAAQGVTVLPDGSAFATVSMPLPESHWLFAPRGEWDSHRDEFAECPTPILTHAVCDAVVAATRYAIRGATMCGKEMDFDPDALVQNAVYALCGPFGGAAPQPAEPSPRPVPHQAIAGALFDFAAYLTTRPQPIELGSSKEAYPAVEALQDWAKTRGLSLRGADVSGWNASPQLVGEWQHLMPYGYAPGNYMNRCRQCNQTVSSVDKRAVTCRTCAEKLHAAAQQPAEPLRLWCETCEGGGKVHQEHQFGCHVGGAIHCPDCDGKGYIEHKGSAK